MFTIDLWDYDGVGLIIAYPSGVTYVNQAGGLTCRQPELEGVFVPLTAQLSAVGNELQEYFTGPKWKGRCDDGIDVETADFVDGLLRAHDWAGSLQVDRDRLSDSLEAWIHMRVGGNGFFWPGFEGGHGVLVWENSD
ncbi:MAG: DUF6210 family protein [Verrucomicrobiota bacterium]